MIVPLITLWCNMPSQKLTVPQLIKKFSDLMETECKLPCSQYTGNQYDK